MDHHTVCLLPWLKLKRDVSLGGFQFVQWPSDKDVLPDDLAKRVTTIASMYCTLFGKPRDKATIVLEEVPSSLPPLDTDTDRYSRAISLLGMALMGENSYFAQLGTVCNSSALEAYFHNFRLGSDFLALTRRRRDGRQMTSGMKYHELKIAEPQQCCCSNDEFDASDGFLEALGTLGTQRRVDRLIMQAASLYMQANTDAPNVLLETELVVAANTVDVLLGSPGHAADVANGVASLMERFGSVALGSSNRVAQRNHCFPAKYSDWCLHKAWAWELYDLRSKLSHGDDVAERVRLWHIGEHLVAAAFLVPLFVKLLLAGEGRYELSDDEEGTLHAVDKMLDEVDWHEYDDGCHGRWHRTLVATRSSYTLQKQIRQGFEELKAEDDRAREKPD